MFTGPSTEFNLAIMIQQLSERLILRGLTVEPTRKENIPVPTSPDEIVPYAAPQPQSACRTVTLTDEPEDSDAFSGPHQRVADAVAGLIEPATAKGISIGLEGSWGSGKTTVARLLAKKFGSDENTTVISFDAWAHEGDPLRRTFLETLIRKLQDAGWVDQTLWDQRIDELANRREVVTSKDNLAITRWGQVLAISLLLIPLGSAFITAALREEITFAPGPWAWTFLIYITIGLLLTFMPLLIFLVRIRREPDILSLFFNKGPTERTTVTSKTINPTSIEFEDNFESLLTEALDNNQKRVVLILDNLDRIDASDALSIWSTLQTFLQHRGTSRLSWHDRLWLLVLYDPDGLSKLWKNDNEGITARSFIDKSFQIRFEVPPLMLSDWSGFLMSQLRRAFPDHDDIDRHEVYRVLAVAVAQDNKPLTIRELKLFVNQMGAIHRQWAGETAAKDAFPLSLIAYYVLQRRRRLDVIFNLFDSDFPPAEYQGLLGQNARENLAAIAFNVEPAAAQQLMFSGKITNLMVTDSPNELKQIALLKGFWNSFEQLATKEWVATEPNNLPVTALTLEDNDIFETASEPQVRNVKRAMIDRAMAVGLWSPLDQRKASGLAVLLKWKSELLTTAEQNEQFVSKLFTAVAQGLLEQANQTEAVHVKNWLEYVKAIVKDLLPEEQLKALATIFDVHTRRLLFGEPISLKQMDPLLEVLAELQELPGVAERAEKSLPTLIDEGHLTRKWRDAATNNVRVTAWIVYLLLRYSTSFPNLPVRPRERNEKNEEFRTLDDPQLPQTLVAILERFKQTGLLIDGLKRGSLLKSLLRESLKIALRNPEASNLFTTSDGVERLEFVFQLERTDELEGSLTKIVSEVQKQVDVATKLMKRNFNPDSARLYLELLRKDSARHDDLIQWCLAGLRKVGMDLWIRHLRARGTLLKLSFYLKTLDHDLDLGATYSNALITVLNYPPKSDWLVVAPRLNDNVASLLGPLDSKSRDSFDWLLADHVKNTTEALPYWFYSLFGPELIALLRHAPQGAEVLELLPAILGRLDPVELAWLRDALSTARTELKERYFAHSVWAKFRADVRQMLIVHGPTTSLYALIKGIADTLNAPPARGAAITFADSTGDNIYRLDDETSEAFSIVNASDDSESVAFPSWSPDGSRLAYTVFEDACSQIFVFDTKAQSNTEITPKTGQNRHANWSPDGNTLAFVSAFVRGDKPNRAIAIIDLNTGEESRLTDITGKNQDPSWSPDGKKLVFSRTEETITRIWVMEADGSNQKPITEGPNDFEPAWSPTEPRIAFARRDAVEKGIYVMQPDGSEITMLLGRADVFAPVWSPDGTKLLFQSGESDLALIFQMDADGQNLKEVTRGLDPAWQALPDPPTPETE